MDTHDDFEQAIAPSSGRPPAASRQAFGEARSVDIAVSGARVRVTDDAYSDRVRCDHPAVQNGRALGRGLDAAAELLGRQRVVVFAEPHVAEGLAEVGYEQEARIPGFYRGDADCLVMGLARVPEREGPGFPDDNHEVDEILEEKGGLLAPPNSIRSRPARIEDAKEMAQLLGSTFQSYPTPSNDPAYVAEQIRGGTPFRVVEQNGQIVACASAELLPEAKTAELTDCATRPAARGRGMMRRLLADLMGDLRRMGYPTAFTLARARIPGVNVAFARLGFTLRGTMLQSCRIGDGLEDMNVWSRTL